MTKISLRARSQSPVSKALIQYFKKVLYNEIGPRTPSLQQFATANNNEDTAKKLFRLSPIAVICSRLLFDSAPNLPHEDCFLKKVDGLMEALLQFNTLYCNLCLAQSISLNRGRGKSTRSMKVLSCMPLWIF